jgi:D-alanyl-D-alanine dipeptidase
MGYETQNLRDILTQPVPDQAEPLALKDGYRDYPIWRGHEFNDEPVVDISEFGIAGQSYYSRPNNATGEPVRGVNPTVYLRQSTAQRLADINTSLGQHRELIAELLGGEVELYVEDGLRSRSMQGRLYDEVFPMLIREQNPGITDEAMAEQRKNLIAAPRNDETSPSPHECGAGDVTLRYVKPDLGFVAKSMVDMGHKDASVGPTVRPDHYEHIERPNARERQLQLVRRVFYWTMRGALLREGDSGLVVNPTEYWHWSHGDQMWAALTRAPYAVHGAQEAPQS